MPSGSGKEDTAVIQFHSQREIDHRRFQGLGVVKEVCTYAVCARVSGFDESAGGVVRILGTASCLVC